MTTKGIFTSIVNDGKRDRVRMTNASLNERLLEIERLRSKNRTPMLVNIERTPNISINPEINDSAQYPNQKNFTA
jgi:hypothetical protein